MAKTIDHLDQLDTMLTDAAGRGLLHLAVDDAALDGRTVTVDGRTLINFGSCSYLGLEVDERLKQGAIDALMRYGTQFSSSRAYLSAPPYAALEAMLEELFGAPVLVTPTTSLGHLSALPVLIDERDAVILDQQVHNSVQVAVNQLRVQKVHVELVRHNRMDDLEEKILSLRGRYRRIWYLADGVYSMYGDFAPLDALSALMDRYPEFRLYIDDAHGMSWSGPNGRGYVLGRLPMREQMVVATSLNKAFAGAGGVLIFPDAESRRRVRTCGGPMIFAGPIQPPMLGALLASARLHLSGEIAERQRALAARTTLCHRLMVEAGLPVMSEPEAPIHFVGMGLPRVAYNLVARLQADGFYTNVAVFPAVPMRRAGLRFTTTTHQTEDDIRALVAAIARHLPAALAEEGSSLEAIRQVFKLPAPEASQGQQSPAPEAAAAPEARVGAVTMLPGAPALSLTHVRTIGALDAAEWDRMLGDRGTFTAAGLRDLERAFSGHADPAQNWNFHYFVARDPDGRAVGATFFTDALWKDDMLASEAVSAAAEARRAENPGFLISRNFAMGSMLTEGVHLYLDRGADWRGALMLILEAALREQDACGATALILRDLPTDDPELDQFLLAQGFLRSAQMDSLVIDPVERDDARYLAALSPSARRHMRKKVLPWDGAYRVEVLGAHGRAPEAWELDHFHALYKAVKAKNLELNTFELPRALFDVVARSEAWEIVALTLDPALGGDPDGKPVAVSLSFRGRDGHYVPHVFGLDYRFVESHGAYRQLLRQVIGRGRALDATRITLGIGATFEKTRFGAKVEPRAVYAQAADHFAFELLAQLKAETAGR